jgi:hypothetical protein
MNAQNCADTQMNGDITGDTYSFMPVQSDPDAGKLFE